MTEDLERLEAVRAIRDALVKQMVRLDQLGESRTATDLSPAIERLNCQLGEAPSVCGPEALAPVGRSAPKLGRLSYLHHYFKAAVLTTR